MGSAAYEVTGCTRIGGTTVYRVVEQYTAPDVGNKTRERTVHYSTETLAEVWDVCGAHGVTDDCRGEHAWLLFPLQDGKTWNVGDEMESTAVAHLEDDASPWPHAWIVTTSPTSCDCLGPRRETAYSPEAGVPVHVRYWGGDGEVASEWWRVEHQPAKGPVG